MRSVDVDCNREDSPAGRAHTRLVDSKERKEHTGAFTRIPRIYTNRNKSLNHKERREHTAGRNSPDFTGASRGNREGRGFTLIPRICTKRLRCRTHLATMQPLQ